jgi:DNA (cytosine-5)-methyltransferase 1
MNELALFAGAGGGILGGKLLGWRTVCAVEWEKYPACVLAARQNDGLLESFPIWDDVQTFDGKPWRGIVDVVSGGFPCQDISAAGKGAGIDGERSGMWREMARIIGEVRPQYAFVENSPMLTTRGLGTILSDLAQMGFNAEWGVLSAADVGANHLRERMWVVAKNTDTRCKHGKQGNASKLATNKAKRTTSPIPNKSIFTGFNKDNWKTEPDVVRMVNGVADTVDRLKAIGNGQVPLCAATAWELLSERLANRGHE